RDQEQRPAHLRPPDKVAADRPQQLEPVADSHHLHEIRRYLAVGQLLNRELNVPVAGRRGNRVAPDGLVTVLGGEPHIDVLTGDVSGPVRHLEVETADPRILLDDLDQLRQPPPYSPQ